MKDKNKAIMMIVLAFFIVIGILSFSFAYFSARVTKTNETQTKVKSNTLGLIYTGVTDINYESMIPGDSFIKTFTVENTSNRTVDYNIYMEGITNKYNEAGVLIGEIPSSAEGYGLQNPIAKGYQYGVRPVVEFNE